jgi:hypothetical protein
VAERVVKEVAEERIAARELDASEPERAGLLDHRQRGRAIE